MSICAFRGTENHKTTMLNVKTHGIRRFVFGMQSHWFPISSVCANRILILFECFKIFVSSGIHGLRGMMRWTKEVKFWKSLVSGGYWVCVVESQLRKYDATSIYSMKDAGRYTCRIHNKKQQCLFTESCDVTIVENPNPPTFSSHQSQIPLSVMHHDRLART